MGWARKRIWRLRLAAHGPVIRNLALLNESQRLPEPELRKLQQDELQGLLLHAYHSTDYYHRIVGHCGVVSADGEVHLDRFASLPLMDKALLQTHFENLKSADLKHRKWYVNSGSGSSGEPARFVQDAHYHAWTIAVKLHFDDWTGYQLGDRKVVLWGSVRDVDGSANPLRTRVGRWLSNETWLGAFCLSDEDMLAHARAINNFRPVQLLAYAESAYELSRFIEQADMRVYSPRSIMTSAGMLFPSMRDTIERVFRTPVFDRYGSREVGDIACQCEQHQGQHIAVPYQHVEILRQDGSATDPGEEGEIVVTNLRNYAMPLIRYRIGDTGLWANEPCSCGRTWPLIARVTGRTTDTLVTKSGARVSGLYFFHQLRTQDWLKRFRIIQEEAGIVDVYLEPARELEGEDLRQLDGVSALVRDVMGDDCLVNLRIVSKIEPLPSGKHLSVISKVRGQENPEL